MKTIVSKHKDVNFVGIVKSRDWFHPSVFKNTIPFLSLAPSYVVGTWADYHDGQQSHIEGAMTIAICKHLKDARVLYRQYNP